MSLLTCCPSCGTQFRVVSDQLRISDGWVRCGRCQEVFDASQSLQEYQEPEPEPLLGRASAHTAATPTPPSAPAEPPQPERAAPDAAIAQPSAPTALASTPATPPAQLAAALPAQPSEPSEPEGVALQTDVLAQRAAPANSPSAEPTLERSPRPEPLPKPVPEVRPEPTVDVEASKPRSEPQVAPTPVPSQPVAQPQESIASLSAEASALVHEPVLDAQSNASQQSPTPSQPMLLQESQVLDAPVIVTQAADGRDAALGATAVADGEPLWDEGAPVPLDSSQQGVLPPGNASSLDEPVQAKDAATSSASSSTGDDVEQVVPKDDAAGLGTEPAGLLDTDPLLEAAPEAGIQAGIAKDTTDDQPSSCKQEQTTTPSFVRQAQRQERWRRPWVRALLALLALILPALLLGQIALHERNALAARVPALQPALEALCQAIGCQVAPPQNIAMVVIAGSSFTQESTSQRYRLDVSLRNQSTTLVATPALELTLTDASDQPLARKVFLPADLHSPQALGARAEWNGSFPVQLQELPQPVVGYRVQLFYP